MNFFIVINIFLLGFLAHLVPPTDANRWAACQTLCGQAAINNAGSYSDYFYKLPSFTGTNSPYLSGRLFGISSQTGWEDHDSFEVVEKEGYELKNQYQVQFGKKSKKTHITHKKGGQTQIKIGVA